MPDIAGFLTARLDEEERTAKAACCASEGVWTNECDHDPDNPPPSHDMCANVYGDIRIYDEGGHSPEQACHIARQDPSATLDRVAALRAVVAMHRPSRYRDPSCTTCYDPDTSCAPEGVAVDSEVPWPCPTLRALASAYRRHPEFDEAWAMEVRV